MKKVLVFIIFTALAVSCSKDEMPPESQVVNGKTYKLTEPSDKDSSVERDCIYIRDVMYCGTTR